LNPIYDEDEFGDEDDVEGGDDKLDDGDEPQTPKSCDLAEVNRRLLEDA